MSETIAPLRWGEHTLEWGTRTHIMGIINVTPDSFSLDGLVTAESSEDELVRAAIARALAMVRDGATLIDVGGESTRPESATRPALPESAEIARIVPVIRALASTLPSGIIMSVDTWKAGVAAAALDAGASMVNDIWGLRADDGMAAVVADRGVPIVLMSNLRQAEKRDPVSDVASMLADSLARARAAGIPWEHTIVDPGFGFGLRGAENLQVLRRLGELRVFGRPILVGTSRKAHIGMVLGLPVEERLEGTAATVALAIAAGADIVRVHDVREMARVARMTDAVVRGWQEEVP